VPVGRLLLRFCLGLRRAGKRQPLPNLAGASDAGLDRQRGGPYGARSVREPGGGEERDVRREFSAVPVARMAGRRWWARPER
jgi:hypothetical protein